MKCFNWIFLVWFESGDTKPPNPQIRIIHSYYAHCLIPASRFHAKHFIVRHQVVPTLSQCISHVLRFVWISAGTHACLEVLCFWERVRKCWIMQEASFSKAVRQGDPREQDCVWKIWRSVWSSMTASLLLSTSPFSNSNLTAKFKIGCTESSRSIRTFTV